MPKPIRAVFPAFIALGVITAFSALAVIASEPMKKVPPRVLWRATVGMGNNWNREQDIAPILNGRQIEGMSRAAVLNLFGDPGYSAVNYPGSSRIDEYRLSAKNNRVFRIDYGRDGVAESGWVEEGACNCPICEADSPAVSIETIRRAGLLKDRGFIDGSLTVRKLEQQLGAPGSWDSGTHTAGGQVWLSYSDTWRITGQPSQSDQYLIADGHTPFRGFQPGKEKDLGVDSWAVVTFIPNCLPQ